MALFAPSYTQDALIPAYQDRLQTASIPQAGVVGSSGDYLVTPGTGLQVNVAAGRAYVAQTGATEGAFYNGMYFQANDGAVTPYNSISAPITNPRVDQVILRIYDNPELSAGGSSFARVEWLVGTEAAGATIGVGGNRNGAAALPASSLRLADVLQTVGEVSIPAANIFDRRPKTRGHTNIATTETRTNTAYGVMPTADQVTEIVLASDALIVVAYQATWQEAGLYAARAAIFVNSTQLKIAGVAAGPVTQAGATGPGQASPAHDEALFTGPWGLFSTGGAPSAYTGDVTTGQIIGGLGKDTIGLEINGAQTELTNATIAGSAVAAVGGPCYIFAAAGTYHISVQFKASSLGVTAKNRKLWVWTMNPDQAVLG